ncbi:MAG: Rne/Rng family ribonuclease [Candidatus Omnitrophica bacterium]|nr:Rne/Rng family ribonuclease [Candidatus Omnitrophota bacterium]
MQKQILINAEPKETRVAVLESDVLQEYYVERPGYKRVVGNIYKGKVDAIITGLAAAFVDIGLEKDGFLYAGNVATDESGHLSPDFDDDIFDESKRRSFEPLSIDKLLKKGQEVLIQIEKEAIGTKGPRITQYISIPGRFLVLMPLQKGHVGISKKIEGEERARIKKILADIRIPGDVGLIVRTAAQGVSAREIGRELKFLLKIWGRIRGIANREKAPKIVYEEYDLILRVVRDLFTDDVEALIIDSKDEYRRVEKFLKMVLPNLRQKVKLYRKPKGLFDEYGIEKEVDKLYSKKVMLRSKGTLVIEQTESLVAIDVNTAGFTGKRNPEETAFATNLEAAREIARQIRLRDMGGIIIIDFIDMELRDHRKKVQHTLEEALRRDKAKTEVLSVSNIGVIEMTRQRMGRSLLSMSFRECPYCQGDGFVKSVSTVSIEIFRNLKKTLNEVRARNVDLRVHPEVAEYLHTHDKNLIHFIERRYRCRVNVKPDPTLHVEDAHVIPS